ncbi:transposase [Siccirubricoccus sp. G192]|uniref:transposase n=1 Tax=Siccirubricoccus sp. G192 TaxID=2849651 RepID=UPI001C2CA4DF|nr:transposase [Siccirubricoccus sp. G192]MBV1799823.1 transposase [Siccirubricoccus sp. G192]
MPNFLPPDFPSRLEFLHRVSLDPIRCRTPVRPWAPLTDDEWEAIAPSLAAMGCGLSLTRRAGRPPADTRARLDAIFRAVTLKHPRGGRAAWAQLPEAHGKADTVSRSFRRWAHAKLWARLLMEVACPTCPAALRGLTYWVCCAFRRGIRIMGLRAITLARRLRLHSALPAPSCLLWDRDLSEKVAPILPAIIAYRAGHPDWRVPKGLLRAVDGLVRLCLGRKPRRWMEPA